MAEEYPRPALTVDLAPLRFAGGHLEILLVERGRAPFQGQMALPGGFVDEGESPLEAARRELAEETAISSALFLESRTFGNPGRDPRGWVVSVAFIALVDAKQKAKPGDDATQACWCRLTDLPELAFDHDLIIEATLEVLRRRTQWDTTPLRLLPETFRTAQARHLYSQLWGQAINPRTFKAWLRRRNAVSRVGPGRFEANAALIADWLR